MTINQRTKGHGGEREFAQLMRDNLKGKHLIERNVDQVRDGGADIVSVPPFAIEVKRQKQLHINQWWQQAVKQTTDRNPIPVLVFRQDFLKWRVMLPSRLLFKKRFKTKKIDRVEVNLEIWWSIANEILKKH